MLKIYRMLILVHFFSVFVFSDSNQIDQESYRKEAGYGLSPQLDSLIDEAENFEKNATEKELDLKSNVSLEVWRNEIQKFSTHLDSLMKVIEKDISEKKAIESEIDLKINKRNSELKALSDEIDVLNEQFKSKQISFIRKAREKSRQLNLIGEKLVKDPSGTDLPETLDSMKNASYNLSVGFKSLPWGCDIKFAMLLLNLSDKDVVLGESFLGENATQADLIKFNISLSEEFGFPINILALKIIEKNNVEYHFINEKFVFAVMLPPGDQSQQQELLVGLREKYGQGRFKKISFTYKNDNELYLQVATSQGAPQEYLFYEIPYLGAVVKVKGIYQYRENMQISIANQFGVNREKLELDYMNKNIFIMERIGYFSEETYLYSEIISKSVDDKIEKQIQNRKEKLRKDVIQGY
jgi:hypothetical protein